jgi:hypothetical protein
VAQYRPVYVDLWASDDKFQDYGSEGKLLFLYLITNSHCNEAGVYRITYKTISNETEISKARVRELLSGELSDNVSYDETSNVIFVHKFLKYNGRGNPSYLNQSIERDMRLIKTSLWNDFIKTYGSLPCISISNSKDSSNKKKPPKLKFSDDHLTLAKLMEKEIATRLPKHKLTGNYLENWANEFRLMEVNDKRTIDEMSDLIVWIYNDKFWYKNVLSAVTFRDKFGRLWEEMRDEKPKRDTVGSSRPEKSKEQKKTDDTYVEKRLREERRVRSELEMKKIPIGEVDSIVQDHMAKWHESQVRL